MSSHKRKPFDKLLKGKYTREKLCEAIILILQGKTDVEQASKDFKISTRTLRRYKKQALEDLTNNPDLKLVDIFVKDKGPKTSLPPETEHQLKVFIEDAKKMGIPRSQSMVADDIQAYVTAQRMKVPFTRNRPGQDYFDRFSCNCDGTKVAFMHPYEVNAFMSRDVDIWSGEVMQYVIDEHGHPVRDKGLLYMMESQRFKTNTNPQRLVTVMVIYNARGEVVKWILVTDGSQLSDDLAVNLGSEVLLLKSQDGAFDSTSMKNALIIVKRHSQTVAVQERSLIFFDQFLAQDFDFSCWKYLKDNAMSAVAIPRSICRSMMTLKVTVMSKYASRMLLYMYRFLTLGYLMTEQHILHLHKQVSKHFKSGHQLTKAFACMNVNGIVSVPPLRTDDIDAENEGCMHASLSSDHSPVPMVQHAQKLKPKRGKARSRQKSTKVTVECGTDVPAGLLPVGTSTGTQTEETSFKKDLLKELRLMHCCDEIRVQDFKEVW